MDTLTLRPPLFIEEIFTQRTCDQIIEYFKSGSTKPRSYQGLVDDNVRKCDFITLPDQFDHHFHQIVRERMQPYFERDIDPRLRARPMVYGYPVGVGFVPHHDQVTKIESARGKTNGQPVIGGDYTIVLFCSSPDEYDGGDLFFPEHGWTYRPPAGSAVVYPTTVDYVHGVKPITRGIRYTTVCRIFNYA